MGCCSGRGQVRVTMEERKEMPQGSYTLPWDACARISADLGFPSDASKVLGFLE